MRTTPRTSARTWVAVGCVVAGMASVREAAAQPATRLDESCIVSVLNRNVRVKPDGSWVLPNIPATFGMIRARVTCVRDGQTLAGESAPFAIPADGSIDVPRIALGVTTPIPSAITVTGPAQPLAQVGAAAQLAVLARYDDGSSRDVSRASAGTRYSTSNGSIASITADGMVQALASGTVIVQASNEGASGFTTVQVVLSADTDGDGITDDIELSLGLNPNDAADGYEDADTDGASNRDEAAAGSSPRDSDSDDDTILDGEELRSGADGYRTNPLAADTDGDGVRDALEVATNSDPTDASSVNLAQALTAITVTPTSFALLVSSLNATASEQLAVAGLLRDGSTIDLTPTQRGTNYASSDLDVCNFAGTPGRVFASNDGTCTITVTNAGFAATTTGTVSSFQPTALSSIAIPGYANNVDANGGYAYVAAGAAGLVILDVSRPQFPAIVATLDTPGNANDVRVVGTRAYVADGPSGLRIIDVTTPAAPVALGGADTAGEASDVIVSGTTAYVADGTAGVAIVDVSNPSTPSVVRVIDTPGVARGVDVEGTTLVVVDDATNGSLFVIDVIDPASAAIVGSVSLVSDMTDVDLANGIAVVAAYASGVVLVDVSTPTSPVLVGSIPANTFVGFVPRDVQVAGSLAIFAEQLLSVAAAPIVDISTPSAPRQVGTVTFNEDYAGTGIAISGPYVFWTGEDFVVNAENGVTGMTKLFIGAYRPIEDRNGLAPTVTITAPAGATSATETTSLTVRATASDDVAVASVTFTIDGASVFTDTSEPYEAEFVMPAAPATLAVGALAIDFGRNTASAAPVTVTVTPDPMTTATGRVVDGHGAPVAGATVSALGRSALSAGDGTFSLSLPTLLGDFIVSASGTVAGETLTGRSLRFQPLAGATVAVGDIVLGGLRVGYTDVGANGGVEAQVASILAAGGRPMPLGRIGDADLGTLDVLVIQNDNTFQGDFAEFGDQFDEFVQGGGVMVVHDRSMMSFSIPGLAGTTLVGSVPVVHDLDVSTPGHPVVNGPHGVLTDTSLDGADASMYGYADEATAPAGTQAILHHPVAGATNRELVTFAYPHGQGWVIYSTLPIIHFLNGGGSPDVRANVTGVYLPNVIAWAMQLRRGEQP